MSTKGQFGERWEVCESIDGRGHLALAFVGRMIIRLETEAAAFVWRHELPTEDELFFRIVACVNACDGIPTEALEAGVVARLAAGEAIRLENTDPHPASTPTVGPSTGRSRLASGRGEDPEAER